MLGGAWATWQAMNSLRQAALSEEQNQRAREQHAQMQQSLDQYSQVVAYMADPKASEILGAGRLALRSDLEAVDMFNANGLYIGEFEGQPIFYNGDRHGLSYGRTRSGKGRDIILSVLGSAKKQSFIINDIKDAENAYSSAAARAALGQEVLALNPFNIAGIEGMRLNPCQRMIDIAQSGYELSGEDKQFIELFLPMTPKQAQAENSWALEGAREILQIRAKYLAYFRPEECNPAGLWHMANGGADKIRAQYQEMIRCGDESISEPAASYLHEFETSEKQYAGYQTGLKRAVWPYAPQSVFAEETRVSDFDPADLKRVPTTVYAMLPTDKIEVGAQWLSLTISSMMERIAAATGDVRTTVLLDEMANLPYMPIIPKALKLFGGKGVRLWAFCQGRHSLVDAGYSKETIREFEDQSGFLQLWEVEDTDLLKDIETWSGKKGVVTRSATMGGGGGLQGSFSVSEQARSVLQAEDSRAVGEGQQLLKIAGIPHIVLAERMPWFEYPKLAGRLNDPRDITRGLAENWTQRRMKRNLTVPPPPEEDEPDEMTDAELLSMALEENDHLRDQIGALKEKLEEATGAQKFDSDILNTLTKALTAIAAQEKPS